MPPNRKIGIDTTAAVRTNATTNRAVPRARAKSGNSASGANFVMPASAMRIPRPIGFPHASSAPSTSATGSASLAFVFATKSENGNASHAYARTTPVRGPRMRRPRA